MGYSDIKIKYIKALVEAHGKKWQTITDAYNDEFEEKKTTNAIRKVFQRYEMIDLDDDSLVTNLEKARKAAIENQKLRKTQKALLDHNIDLQDVLDQMKTIVESGTFKKYKIPKVKKSKKKKNMIIEPLISDIHFGLKTETYNVDVARKSLQTVAKVAKEELNRYEKIYNISKFNILLNGDLIQSSTMHKDSHASCVLTNAEQLAVAVESIFLDLILPLATTGHKIDIIGMCGNHDRESYDRFTVDPGRYYYTYTIYKTLELVCKQSKLKNVNITIPNDPFLVYDIFGSYFLVEHGDLLSGKGSMETLEKQIHKRSVQVGKLIKGIRIGHFHNDLIGSLGRYIINGSSTSNDHYSKGLGYKSRPCQLINYYVETKRSNPYYHTLVVNLE